VVVVERGSAVADRIPRSARKCATLPPGLSTRYVHGPMPPETEPVKPMALWRLTPRGGTLWWCVEGKDPWQPPFDRAFGFVVRAADEEEARWVAHQAAGEENGTLDGIAPWLDASYSACEEMEADGASEVVLVNFRHAPR
jgi:hypothetical protein